MTDTKKSWSTIAGTKATVTVITPVVIHITDAHDLKKCYYCQGNYPTEKRQKIGYEWVCNTCASWYHKSQEN